MSTATLREPEQPRTHGAEFDLRYEADAGLQPLGPITSASMPGGAKAAPVESVGSRILGGTWTLGLGTFIERAAGFLANILAARFAGSATFGAYSLAISTANNISTYAAGGIGATAARFSGKYQYGTNGYSTLARALTIVSLLSASLAAGALWLGAGPIATLLGKHQLTGLLKWAAVSAAGIILLECARGFFVGQRRLIALILLSLVVGTGMITLLPAAARLHNASRMIVLQGLTTSAAVVVCLLFAGRLKLRSPQGSTTPPLPLVPMLREVWSFGLVQLAGLVASNLAGWWLMTLVARADTTLVQMSFFAIASQLRNLVGIAPGLLTEGSYAIMADPGGEATRTPHRVMALCSYASTAMAMLIASAGVVLVPWALTLLYGRSYAGAELTVAVGLAIAVVHMGNAPAAARLTIVSIRATGVINTTWAVFVAAAATLLLFHGGSAVQAMAIYFAGHVLSAALVLFTLARKDHVPAGMVLLFTFATAITSALVALAWFRSLHRYQAIPCTAVMFGVLVMGAAGLFLFGRRFQWLPSPASVRNTWQRLRGRINPRERYV